jgi:voltage-gated potassium channel Kch
MSNFTLREQLRYRFDNTLAKGTAALVAWLAIVSVVGVSFLAGVVVVLGAAPEGEEGKYSFGEAAWGNLMRTLDAGTMGGDHGWLFRILMLVVTLFGVFVLSALIGVLSSGLDATIEELRKGRSRVVEREHTVILGWSDQIFAILTELIEANSSRKNACIVVLGDKDKVEMDDAIRDKVGDTKNTRIVCRRGVAIEVGDLALASIDTARAIIIVAPESDGQKNDDPDVDVIKALLAITNNPKRKKERYHIVAEIRDPKNAEVAQMVGKDEVEVILVGDLVARVMAQTCRQSGLSIVYQELLDFGGDEIYFIEEPALVGKTFAESLFAYDECAVMGLYPKAGIPVVNPKHDTPIRAGDRLIVIAEDDDAVKPTAPKPADSAMISLSNAVETTAEKTLILGWNWRAPSVINELDNYVAHGSNILVVADHLDAEEVLRAECAALKRQTLTFQHGDTTDRRTLDSLQVSTFNHVIVLCYDQLEAQKADAATLITLLHLRDMADKATTRISVVSEMLDIKNRTLAEVTKADDFIVSDRLVSLMLSQVSENKGLNTVFKDLFSPEGSEIYLKPATGYVKLGAPMTFTTVMAAAAQKGESAIGYKLAAFASDADKQYGVAVNPPKSDMVTFGPNDRVIVLAEN